MAIQRAGAPLLLAGMAVLLLAVPGVPPLCPLRVFLHVPCPSCGLTRAARLALSGDFASASRVHPLWFLVLPFVGGVGALECALYLRNGVWGRVVGGRGVRLAAWGIVIVLVGVWLARELGAFGGPVPISGGGSGLEGESRRGFAVRRRIHGGSRAASWAKDAYLAGHTPIEQCALTSRNSRPCGPSRWPRERTHRRGWHRRSRRGRKGPLGSHPWWRCT
jgi:hypothetical protein